MKYRNLWFIKGNKENLTGKKFGYYIFLGLPVGAFLVMDQDQEVEIPLLSSR